MRPSDLLCVVCLFLFALVYQVQAAPPVPEPTIEQMQRDLRDACESQRKAAQDARDQYDRDNPLWAAYDAERQYWLTQRRIIESSISARELPRPDLPSSLVVYTHHPAVLAAYPDQFVRSEVVVNNDFGPVHRLPTIDEIDAALADPDGRLNIKLRRAAANGSPVLLDAEPISYRPEDAEAERRILVHLLAGIREAYPTVYLTVYQHCGRFDRMLVGEARIAEGHPWWSQPHIVAEIADRRIQMDETLAALDLSTLDVDAVTPVCYQSREFYGLPEDRRYYAVDWLPPTLTYAETIGHDVIPIIWLRSLTQNAGVVDVDLAELRSICQILHDAGHRRVMLWVGYDDPIDTPEFEQGRAIVQEFFGT